MALGNRKIINPFKPMLKTVSSGVLNRYWIVLVIFFIWMALLDKASFWTQYKLSRSIKHLQVDKIYYQNKMKELDQTRLDIQNDREKFARERYFMKTTDEDVFVIDKKTN